MVQAFALLLVFQLVGEVIAQGLQLPVPGPLIGMLLLFIPAVTGVMLYFDRIEREALPFFAACVIGAALTLVATALTLQWMLRLTRTPHD